MVYKHGVGRHDEHTLLAPEERPVACGNRQLCGGTYLVALRLLGFIGAFAIRLLLSDTRLAELPVSRLDIGESTHPVASSICAGWVNGCEFHQAGPPVDKQQMAREI